MTSQTPFEEQASSAVALMRSTVPFLTWFVTLVDDEGSWRTAAQAGDDFGDLSEVRIPWEDSFCGRRGMNHWPTAVPHLLATPAYLATPSSAACTVGCFLGATLRDADGTPIGSLSGITVAPRETDDLSEHVALVERTAEALSLALRTDRSRRHGTTPVRTPRRDGFEQDAEQVVRLLQRLVPDLTWLVAMIDGMGDWIPVATVGNHYGLALDAGAPWHHTVCHAHEVGGGPTAAPVLAAVPAYTAAPITRELTVGCWTGATITSAQRRVLGSVCGIHPLPRETDDLTAIGPVVERVAELLGHLHDSGARLAAGWELELEVPQAALSAA